MVAALSSASKYALFAVLSLSLVISAMLLRVSDAAFIGVTGNASSSWGASSDFVSGYLNRWGTETLAPAMPTRFGPDTWSAVTAYDDHTCGIKASDSTLWCWGQNNYGQLGQGTSDESDKWYGPIQVGTSTYTAVAAGNGYTCAIRSTSAMYCWGRNAYRTLGNGTTTDQYSPGLVSGGLTGWTDVQAGDSAACGIRGATHTLYCWGHNSNGQLGVGDNTARATPAQVPGTTWSKAAIYWGHACATTTGGLLYCWGAGGEGQLGQGSGDLTDNYTPDQVTGTGWITPSVGAGNSCATKSTNALYCWGRNTNGENGVGDNTQRQTPALVSGTWSATGLATANRDSCAIKATGTLWCWGANDNQQHGVNDTTPHNLPVQASSNTTWADVVITQNGGCARRTDNSLWCWGGMEVWGGLSYPVQSPTQVESLGSWASVAVGRSHMCAVRNDGTLWCVGFNAAGQLGQGNLVGLATLSQVGSGTTWATVSAGNGQTCATKTDNTLWCWGGNWIGQLGIGNSTWQYTPVQVDSANRYVATAVGEGWACAIRATTYTLWCWGYNDQGQLGTGNTTTYNTPQQVGGTSSWSKVSVQTKHACALRRTTGALYCWGRNSSGQLGNGTTTGPVTTPTLIDSGNAYADIALGRYFTCGIRTTGGLYCWGDNTYGQLGLGTNTDQISPTRVGALTNWYSVQAGYYFACATQVNRTVRCWGSNSTGQLGLGTMTNATSPTQVPGVVSRNIAVGQAAAYAVDLY